MIGEKTGAYAVTMETTALPNLDYHLKHELGPGEIVEITEGGVIQKHAPGDTTKICTFFWVYYGYPSSSYEGINTESARYRNGESMAADDREDTIPEIDSVCGIPDSGIAMRSATRTWPASRIAAVSSNTRRPGRGVSCRRTSRSAT